MIKDKLQIYLITYNRKNYLEKTLNQILDSGSPIKDCDITILDNCSTDGTSELIEEYCKNFKNIAHIRHGVNIGGNANIARAFEMAASCGKEYFWLLGDDDSYEWDSWGEVENAIENEYDAIFTFPVIYKKEHLLCSSLISACIYKTGLLDENVVENIYDNVRNLFPHLALMSKIILAKRRIFSSIKHRIVYVRICENLVNSYNRGLSVNYIPESRKNIIWIVGFFNTLELITDKKLRNKIIKNLKYGRHSLYQLILEDLIITNKVHRNDYFYNYLQVLRFLNFWQILVVIAQYLMITMSIKNYKYYKINDKSEWIEYFKEIKEQNYINKLAKKLKNKEVIIYGAGLVSDLICKNYDLSKLNIIGVSDKKFEKNNVESWNGYKTYKPSEILDKSKVILVGLKAYNRFEKKFKIKRKIKADIYPLVARSFHYPIATMQPYNKIFAKLGRIKDLTKYNKLENRRKLRSEN